MATTHLHSPVRDDSALGPDEDLDRDPDGVNHVVIGAVLLGTIAIAAVVLLALSGHVGRHPGATLAVFAAIPILVVSAFAVARFWRRADEAHPSR